LKPRDGAWVVVARSRVMRDDCEKIEIGDIDAPKEAHITLDHLMADSRPPLS
jgi:hypothetical protein